MSSRPYVTLARLYKALAHPVRLQILQLLAEQEACVCHLATALRRRQPYVSQQLAVLRAAGLVVDRREGLLVYYRLSTPAVVDLLARGRALLPEQGLPVPEPPAVPSPLPGCPCPRCTGAPA